MFNMARNFTGGQIAVATGAFVLLALLWDMLAYFLNPPVYADGVQAFSAGMFLLSAGLYSLVIALVIFLALKAVKSFDGGGWMHILLASFVFAIGMLLLQFRLYIVADIALLWLIMNFVVYGVLMFLSLTIAKLLFRR